MKKNSSEMDLEQILLEKAKKDNKEILRDVAKQLLSTSSSNSQRGSAGARLKLKLQLQSNRINQTELSNVESCKDFVDLQKTLIDICNRRKANPEAAEATTEEPDADKYKISKSNALGMLKQQAESSLASGHKLSYFNQYKTLDGYDESEMVSHIRSNHFIISINNAIDAHARESIDKLNYKSSGMNEELVYLQKEIEEQTENTRKNVEELQRNIKKEAIAQAVKKSKAKAEEALARREVENSDREQAELLAREKAESIIFISDIVQDIFSSFSQEISKREKEKRKNDFYKKEAFNKAMNNILSIIEDEVASELLNDVLSKAIEEVNVEERARIEAEERARIQAEIQAEIQEIARQIQAQQQEIARQIQEQQAEEIKDRILAKTSANFEKFQLFFNHLREEIWLDIGEIGLFGSRVYREVLNETSPALKIPENTKADFDFYCIPKGVDSNGIFKLCHEEAASRENFLEVIEDFNKKNPNLQIYFKDEEIPYALDEIVKKDGEKSVNFLVNQSINFKLVAVILEDKKTSEDETGEEKTEKIVKEKVEFDLNFYTQKTMLEKLQWQFNLERVLLTQNPDRTFALNINHCNCNQKQEKMTIEDFFAKAQGEEMQEFLFEYNPKAGGFLNRMINKKGIYKYLDEETLNALKIEFLNDDIKKKLIKELSDYKDDVDGKVKQSTDPKIADEKFKQAKFILDEIAKDKIFKEDKDFQEILRSIPRGAPTGAGIGSKPIARI